MQKLNEKINYTLKTSKFIARTMVESFFNPLVEEYDIKRYMAVQRSLLGQVAEATYGDGGPEGMKRLLTETNFAAIYRAAVDALYGVDMTNKFDISALDPKNPKNSKDFVWADDIEKSNWTDAVEKAEKLLLSLKSYMLDHLEVKVAA